MSPVIMALGESKMQESDKNWLSSVEEVLSAGERIGHSSEQFDLACEHIVQLLDDASSLMDSKSYATATFLSITALEETAKVALGTHRRSTTPLKRSKDLLYKHNSKHALALGPTVAMGSRLQIAIGGSRMNELIDLGRTGGLGKLREASLYVEQDGQNLNSPQAVVNKSTARDVLLLAIEAFDDALVGYTSRSFQFGERTDALFAKWASA